MGVKRLQSHEYLDKVSFSLCDLFGLRTLQLFSKQRTVYVNTVPHSALLAQAVVPQHKDLILTVSQALQVSMGLQQKLS